MRAPLGVSINHSSLHPTQTQVSQDPQTHQHWVATLNRVSPVKNFQGAGSDSLRRCPWPVGVQWLCPFSLESIELEEPGDDPGYYFSLSHTCLAKKKAFANLL